MNNRILALVATGLALGMSHAKARDLAVETGFAFESEYVFRGVQLATESFQPSLDVVYDDFYVGLWTNQPIEDGSSNEVDYYAGYKFEFADNLLIDVGATMFHYPDTPGDNETLESYVGIAFDSIASPGFRAYYDYDLEAYTFEGLVGHSLVTGERSSLEFGLTLGYVALDDAAGVSALTDYYYYGAIVDWVYRLSDTARLAIGVRGSGNDENLGPGGRETNVWGGFSFSAGF